MIMEEVPLKSLLWGLSNIALTREYAMALLQEIDLYDRVIALCADKRQTI